MTQSATTLCNRWRAPLALAVVLAGCPSERESLDFSLLEITDDCTGPPKKLLPRATYAVRLTFMYRDEQQVHSGNLRNFKAICDRVVLPKQDAEFLVDPKDVGGGKVALRVEAFDQNGKLALFGDNLAFDLSSPDATVYLRPAGEASCVPAARRRHAFHSSTLLPNGQVLLFGGLAADQNGSENLAGKQEAFANAGVELYDPNTLRVLVASSDTAIPPRAFHRAVLLPSPPEGPYKVLVLGGLAPGASEKPVVRLRIQNTKLPFLLSPHEEAVAGEALLLELTPGDTPTIKVTPQPSLPQAMFPELVLSDDGSQALFIPGARGYEATATAITGFTASGGPKAQWIRLEDPPVPGDGVSMRKIRVGHAAARLGKDRVVVVGGMMNGPQGAASSEVAAVAAGGQPSFTNVTPPLDYGMAWHTLTPLGSSDRQLASGVPPEAALLAGGFVLSWDGSEGYRFATPEVSPLVPPQASIQLVEDGTPLKMTDRTALGGYARTAYHAGVRLHDGRVLISGGNGGGKTYDARDQAVLFSKPDGAGLTVDPLSDTLKLATARFGHRATRLLDNTILISGGITLQPGDVPVVTDKMELFAPRVGAASEDYPFDRAPANFDPTTVAHHNRCLDPGESAPAPSSPAPAPPAQSSSAMKILTPPEPRTSSGLRIRTERGPDGRLMLRIAGGTRSR